MSDRAFERSLTALTALVVIGVIVGIVTRVMAWGWLVALGLLVETGGGGYLLYRWGKSYMERE